MKKLVVRASFTLVFAFIIYVVFMSWDLGRRTVASANRFMANPNTDDYIVFYNDEKGVIPSQIGSGCRSEKYAQQISGAPYIILAECPGGRNFKLNFPGPGNVIISDYEN